MTTFLRRLALVLVGVDLGMPADALADPLPSWDDPQAKAVIIAFVEGVTDADSDRFVPEGGRLALFDNDDTLWSDQPVYVQMLYAFDAVRGKAWANPSILDSDVLPPPLTATWKWSWPPAST